MITTEWMARLTAAAPTRRTSLQGTLDRIRLSEVSEAFVNRSNEFPTHWLLIGAGLLLSFLGLHATFCWARRRQMVVHQGWWTFSRLASEVGLAWQDRWLLWQISRHQRLPNPLTLLLSASTLRHYARRYAENRSHRRRVVIAGRVASMRRQLFR